MKIYRPLWLEGEELTPQQFQQQTLWSAYCHHHTAQLALRHPWGILDIQFDHELLTLNKLKVQRLKIALVDGTLIDTQQADQLPPELDLNVQLSTQFTTATVLLALPMIHANGENLQQGEVPDSHPVRYQQDWATVQNLFSPYSESIPIERYACTLRFDHQDNQSYICCPLAQLVRDSQGRWQLDPLFIPPLLSFAASETLTSQLDHLSTQLTAKRLRLMGMRRESNQRLADFAVADVSLFWMLNALNHHAPFLRELQQYPNLPPERVYEKLATLAGALLTFSLDHDISDIPPYQHDNLNAVFPPLFALLRVLLEAGLPSRVMAIVLSKEKDRYWKGDLLDPRLKDNADFYLSVRCNAVPMAQLQQRFPTLCKVGSPDAVTDLVNIALPGVPLLPLSHVPAAVPLRLENQYFTLDLNNEAARTMLDSGYCAFYIPDTLPNVELELFAVLRN